MRKGNFALNVSGQGGYEKIILSSMSDLANCFDAVVYKGPLMPRNVRPSYVHLTVDGRKDDIETGPRNRTGNMYATFLVREFDKPLELFDISFRPSSTGASTSVSIIDRRDGSCLFHGIFMQSGSEETIEEKKKEETIIW